MPWYSGDFKADTADMTLVEQAVYRNLIDHIWHKGGVVENDPVRLLMASGLAAEPDMTNPKKKQILAKIQRFFTEIPAKKDGKNGQISHKRVTELLMKAKKISEIRSEAGKKGGQAKKQKPLNQSNSKALDKSNGENAPQKELNFWDVATSMKIPRALIGKWIKQHGETRVAEVIAMIVVKRPADPVQYVTAVLQDRPKKLHVPGDDNSLWPWATKHGFPDPAAAESNHQYRQRLWNLIRRQEAA